MDSLKLQYDILTKVHIRLDNLIRTSLFKAVRSADEWLLSQQGENVVNRIKRFNEDEYDRIAYNDAINRRFEHYYDLTFKFLQRYLQEKHTISTITNLDIISTCMINELISQDEQKKLLIIVEYANFIKHPYNQECDYECTEDLLMHTVTLNDIVLRLNPSIDLKKYLDLIITK